MKILMTAQHFFPEAVSGAVLATELATDLVERGHKVTFVTSAPSYPEGIVFAGYRNRLRQVEDWQGVTVIRTWSYISPRKYTWPRWLNYGSFSISAFLGGILAEPPDMIFSYSPPLPLGVAAWLLSWLWRVPWVLRVEDLYPDAAIAAGVIRSPLLMQILSALEKLLYRKATHISLISEGFRRNLIEKGVPSQKLSVEPVWADPDFVRPMLKNNAFSKEHRLADNFVVMYAGNMGHNSCLEDVIEAAELLGDHPRTRFVLIGEGVRKDALQNMVASRGLSNVHFLPYQPRERLSEMMATADISLITLNRDSYQTSLPSKTFNIMASGRPILAVTPELSEVANLIKRIGCGVNVAPGAPEQLAQAILDLEKAPRNLLVDMGMRGRQALVTQYSREHCVSQYEKLLVQAVAG